MAGGSVGNTDDGVGWWWELLAEEEREGYTCGMEWGRISEPVSVRALWKREGFDGEQKALMEKAREYCVKLVIGEGEESNAERSPED